MCHIEIFHYVGLPSAKFLVNVINSMQSLEKATYGKNSSLHFRDFVCPETTFHSHLVKLFYIFWQSN